MKGARATALVINDNKILVIHRLRSGDEYFVLPGGHVEEGESVEFAVLRELKEETSIDAKINKEVFRIADSKGRKHMLFLCDYISGTPNLADDSPEATSYDPNNLHEPLWLETSNLEKVTMWPEGTKEFLINYLLKK